MSTNDDNHIENDGIDDLHIPHVNFLYWHKEFLNKDFDDETVYGSLKHIRNYLVHPVIDRGVPASFYNLDQIDLFEAMETMSNLIERIATKILDIELNLMAENDKDMMALLAFYRH